jgi:GntP family gluconate:H+ symporter
MNSLLILLIAMIVVIGGVLMLKLHAFLALVLGALVVSALTAADQVYQVELKNSAIEVAAVDPTSGHLQLKIGTGQQLIEGENLLIRGPHVADLDVSRVVVVRQVRSDENDPRLKVASYTGTLVPQVGDWLLHSTQLDSARRTSRASIGTLVAQGFGATCGNLGILIAMASIIGKCLLESGAAERIVVAALDRVGERRAGVAFLGSGFVLGIPVFFDTVFYLLLPLAKALRLATGRHYVLYVLTIVAGATMAHSLVPPTPGPLFVAEQLSVDVGVMMIAGICVGMVTVAAGYLYACWADRRWNIPLRPSAELSDEQLGDLSRRDPASLPPLGVSLLPIVLPVILIAAGTICSRAYGPGSPTPGWIDALLIVGDKNLALVIAAAVALLLLVKQIGLRATGPAVQTALASAGVIILITAAGGAFGGVLRQTGIAGEIAGLVPASQSALLWLPIAFGITSLVRIAQGSATVAMITAVGIVAPAAVGADLGFHPVYLALAIGCGSKPIPWMNDSGFWIISTMSGFTEAETLKTASVMMTMMGLVGLGVTLLAASLLPLVP